MAPARPCQQLGRDGLVVEQAGQALDAHRPRRGLIRQPCGVGRVPHPIQPARGQRPEHAFRGVLDRQRTCTDLLAQAGVVDEVRADPEVTQRQHVVGVGQTGRKPVTDIVHR